MRRFAAVLVAGLLWALIPFPAQAALRDVSIGNYWFEDDATGARNPITVTEGDQIRFTVRQGVYPPHSAVIDEYDIDSGQLLLFDTYTTPPLNKPGTFALYCRAHRERGHETKLVVKAKPAGDPGAQPSTPAPPKKAKASKSAAPTAAATTPTPGTTAASPSPAEATVPAGVGQATDRRRPPSDPNSLAGVLGRDLGGDVPWTAALWQAALAAIPIAGAAAYALRRERRRMRL